MNPFATPEAAFNKSFSNFQKMTLEEACLILNVTDKTKLNRAYIDEQFNLRYIPTKVLSVYLADRLESARDVLLEELPD